MRSALLIPVLSLAIWAGVMYWLSQSGSTHSVSGVRRVKPKRVRRAPRTLAKKTWSAAGDGGYDLEVDSDAYANGIEGA